MKKLVESTENKLAEKLILGQCGSGWSAVNL